MLTWKKILCRYSSHWIGKSGNIGVFRFSEPLCRSSSGCLYYLSTMLPDMGRDPANLGEGDFETLSNLGDVLFLDWLNRANLVLAGGAED